MGELCMATPSVGTAAKPASAPLISAAIFQQDSFFARQKVFTFVPKVYFYDLQGYVLAFLRRKVFTLNDEIRVFTDETQSMELLYIRPRKIMDWRTALDV